MTHIVVDVETNGPIQGVHSMYEVGAVALSEDGVIEQGFHGLLHPISLDYVAEAQAVGAYTFEQTLDFPAPTLTMVEFAKWVGKFSGPHVLWSDNNGYDAPWVNWYFHFFLGRNPFGYSSRRISDLYCGAKGSTQAGWKHLRDTPHTHNAEDDARGNAEALYKILTENDIKIKW